MLRFCVVTLKGFLWKQDRGCAKVMWSNIKRIGECAKVLWSTIKRIGDVLRFCGVTLK